MRYQTAYGLRQDLIKCKEQMDKKGRLEPFPLGQADELACFRLPNILYGRDEEKEKILAALERVSRGRAEAVLVSGYPGVGKTALIYEALKPAAGKKGFFAAGKFDQLKQNIPYAPFAAAFGNLLKQLMTESQEELRRWRQRLLDALERNGALITGIIPELESIIGKQPPVEELPPKESENRFHMVFGSFLGAFAQKDRPLVLFLDDLHWADQASIHLLKYLIRDAGLRFVLFVGAFRENEVGEDHPLKELLQKDDEEQPDLLCISLMPLSWKETGALVADTLHAGHRAMTDLSEILYAKSGGNPLFLKELLVMLHGEGLLFFDEERGSWEWNLDAIQKLKLGEDILELFVKKLEKLPVESLELLELASCIGNRFELETLSAVWGKTVEEVSSCLMPSILEGLVLEAADPKEKEAAKGGAFRFLHDRVQQAVYSLLPEEEKKEKHLAIGRLLLQKAPPLGLDERIPAIMDHFNRSIDLIRDPEERIKLAEYNLLAGRKAKASGAHASALQYFRCGRALLPKNPWNAAYRLSYSLHLELAQAEGLAANMQLAEELFDIVIEKAGTELERAGVYGLKVILYAGTGKYALAIQTCIQILEKLGVKIPLHPTKLDYARELLLFMWYRWSKRIEDLIDLPEVKEPRQRMIAELMSRLSSVTMISNPDLYSFIILKTGNYTLRHGNSEMAPVGYFGYSITAGSILGDYKAGDRYKNVGIHLAEKYGQSSSKAIIYFITGALISHWNRHASFGLDFLDQAAAFGRESGDMLVIGYAHCILLENRYLMGTSLEKVEELVQEKQELARRLKHDLLAGNAAIYRKVVSVLRGPGRNFLESVLEEFQEEGFLELVSKEQSFLATYYIYKMQLSYLAGDYREALSAGQKVEPMRGVILGLLLDAEYVFYYSLVIAALNESLPGRERRQYLKVLKRNLRQMKKWSEACKENFEHKYLLLRAERARLRGKWEEAVYLYEKAIRSAAENGYRQNESLANELAAGFYASIGLHRIAGAYMKDAYRGYKKWGARAKGEELKLRYPELMDFEEQKEDGAYEKLPNAPVPSFFEEAADPDVQWIVRIAENLAKETDAKKLFQSILDIAVQSVGANRGFFILEKNGELYIEAEKEGASGAVARTVPLEKSWKLSKAVVRYTARTNETVVLNSEERAGIFAGDPYIAMFRPKSVACLPLLFQGIFIGMLYFENSFLPGVFTPRQLEFLKVLFAQIACIQTLQTYLQKEASKSEERPSDFIDPLTDREVEVLRLIAEGMSNKEISDRLGISVNTVKSYIKNIYQKLGANRRVQAVARARELNILE